ncbi:DUF4382 domain-containing protein [Marinobacter alexandrii]|uniref:DUF4382 domain-containing protein n=1 Tax=Marinobacter alexandrii TaxID=2570351 RepID=UPI001FFF6B9F|nr:DUF4382 domain-containing protein [Marinobacter alexandrii]MCK2150557.1 DUF4382 domain-containing protein [Marinobacter alexandrii]
MYRSLRLIGISALAAGVTACGGGSDSSETGTVSFGVTDAPATEFSNVTVAFTEIRLKPEDGDWISFPLNGFEDQNLLELQGGVSAPLITDEEVPAGNYTELRLIVDTNNSFVKLESQGDSTYTLAVPSGEQSGLKLKGDFIVAADTSTDFTVDFDVHKSIVNPQGDSLADYLLKPSMRLVNNLEVGSISGLVDYAQINSTRGVDDTEDALDDCAPNYEGSAYVFAGAGVVPSDLNVNNDTGNPLLVLPVAPDDQSNLYTYTAGFLPAGEYTVSYSCQLDDNETDDTLEFDGTQNVTVVAGETTQAKTIPLTQ